MKWEDVQLTRYEAAQRDGADAAAVMSIAIKDGIGAIHAVRVVRQLFGIDLPTAKDLLTRAETGMSLQEHQEGLLPALQEAFDAAKRDKP